VDLVERLGTLRESGVGKIVEQRLKEFKSNGRDPEKIFSELCFCICTANNSAERGMRAQKEIDFCESGEDELRKQMRKVVCRFYNNKTGFILSARGKKAELLETIGSSENGKQAREWIVKNIRGLGYKEASHFLRNIGYEDVAIIDFHIIDLLEKSDKINRPKTLTRKNYLRIERILEGLAAEVKMNLAELDLYLWYIETGKILK
jgi:N-glycosylase/DNA lyase